MNTKPTPRVGSHAVLVALCSCLLAGPLFAQQKDYQEAHVYITAPGASPTTGPVSPAVEIDRPMLLLDRGFQTFEPLEQPDEHIPTVIIDEKKTFQTIIGFGAAFTDAASTTFGKLPKDSQEQFLKACFDPAEGNGYTLCRTTIHSCDYSSEMYTYDNTPGDKDLKDFSIARDLKDRIPFIKRAQTAAKGNLRLFASPWSPPAWMKTNSDMLHGGKLKPEYNQTWADYFVKYIEAYAREGVPMWGLTVQNEALATQVWESCIFTAEEERDFVKHFLGPTLEKANLSEIKLMIWDHNRGLLYQRVQPAYDDHDASKYIWGAAFHWYTGDHWDNVRIVHDSYPDKHLLYTEGGIGGNWSSALRLARNVIYDLNNWTEGWVVWNLVCDQEGGPRHAGGTPGPGSGTIVNADTTTGKLSFNPPHYIFGQFSRFIRPGAKRIPSTSTSDELIATAALNTDGSIAVVVNNLKDKETFFRIWRNGQSLRYTSPPNATMTFLFRPTEPPK